MSRLKFIKQSVVDADNKFEFDGIEFKISDTVKEYRVYNSYKENKNNFTNESQMSVVKIYMDIENHKILFLNEHNREINKIMVVEE